MATSVVLTVGSPAVENLDRPRKVHRRPDELAAHGIFCDVMVAGQALALPLALHPVLALLLAGHFECSYVCAERLRANQETWWVAISILKFFGW